MKLPVSSRLRCLTHKKKKRVKQRYHVAIDHSTASRRHKKKGSRIDTVASSKHIQPQVRGKNQHLGIVNEEKSKKKKKSRTGKRSLMETRQFSSLKVTSLSSCRQTIYRADKNTKKKKTQCKYNEKKKAERKDARVQNSNKKKGSCSCKKVLLVTQSSQNKRCFINSMLLLLFLTHLGKDVHRLGTSPKVYVRSRLRSEAGCEAPNHFSLFPGACT